MTVIDVFADVACPFTHVGLRRFVERRAQVGATGVVLRIHAWPLEWVNGKPLDAHHIAAEIEAIRAQVAPDLFTGFDPAAFPATSIPAFRLAAAAYRRDDATGEAVSLALRDALFEHGRNIAAPDVLAEIAARHGLGEPAEERCVHDDWAAGRERGVIGSPHFFVGAEGHFCPLLHITRVDGGWHVTQDLSVLDAILGPAPGG